MKVLLLHALPLDHRMWEPQHEVLAGREVVAPDLYGLGRTLDEWVDSALALAGDGDLALVGASMGGYLSLAIARREPGRVRGIALCGSSAAADPPERHAARDELIRLTRARGAEGLWEEVSPRALPPGTDPALVARVRSVALQQSADGLANALEVIRDRSDSRAFVAGFDRPLLVAVGDSDPFASVEEARALVASAPRGRLLALQGCGHLPNLERPAEVNAALADFLESL